MIPEPHDDPDYQCNLGEDCPIHQHLKNEVAFQEHGVITSKFAWIHRGNATIFTPPDWDVIDSEWVETFRNLLREAVGNDD